MISYRKLVSYNMVTYFQDGRGVIWNEENYESLNDDSRHVPQIRIECRIHVYKSMNQQLGYKNR
jgi:hypothetical protein